MKKRFPASHPWSNIRDERKPSPGEIIRTLTRRAAWLDERIQLIDRDFAISGLPKSQSNARFHFVNELAAIAVSIEIVERDRRVRLPPEEGTEGYA